MDLPQKQGLYDPANEHDACGVGFIAHIKGEKRHDIILQGLEIQIGNFLQMVLPNQPEVARKLRVVYPNNAELIVLDNDVLAFGSTKGAVLRHNNTFSIPPSFSLFTVS